MEVPSPLRSQSVTLGPTNRVALSNPARDLRTVSSANIEKCGGNRTYVSSPADTEGLSAPKSRLDADGDSCESDGLSGSSPQGSVYSYFYNEVPLLPHVGSEGSENGLEPQSKEDLHRSSPPSVLVCAKTFLGHTRLCYGAIVCFEL